MKKFFLIAFGCWLGLQMNAQSIAGVWESVDEADNQPVNYVQIYEHADQHFYGKVIKPLRQSPNQACEACPGDLKGQPMMHLEVLEKMKLEGGYYKGGKLLDPLRGRWYACEMWLKEGDPNVLVVRQYVGPLFRTMEWRRVNEVSMK